MNQENELFVNTIQKDTGYIRAIDNLEEFSHLDLSKIDNLADLSAYTSLVGQDLRTLVHVVGAVEQKEFKWDESTVITTAARVIRRNTGMSQIFVIADDYGAYLRKYDRKEENNRPFSQGFAVLAPYEDIHRTQEQREAHAFLWKRQGDTVLYCPTKEASNPDVQKGYASLLGPKVAKAEISAK